MMTNDLKHRTKTFAHVCAKLVVPLPNYFPGNHIKRPLNRYSASVVANYWAIYQAQSKKSFISKISNMTEEVNNSHFWNDFIIDESLISKETCKSLLNEANQLTRIFISARKTANLNVKN